jgi:hypothetical protein
MIIIVLFTMYFSNVYFIEFYVYGSILEVASSNIIIFAFLINALAKQSNCFWPFENISFLDVTTVSNLFYCFIIV